MQSSIVYSDSARGLRAEFPAPPRVHWVVLMVALWVWKILVGLYAPIHYRVLLESLGGDGWAFYLCRWIGTLDDDAKSPFWCDLAVVAELACAGFTVIAHPGLVVQSTIAALGFASAILGLVTIFKIQDDLEKHYNEREPYGIYMSGLMTFFFSFLYFQAKLYPIAKAKHEAAMRGDVISGRPIV